MVKVAQKLGEMQLCSQFMVVRQQASKPNLPMYAIVHNFDLNMVIWDASVQPLVVPLGIMKDGILSNDMAQGGLADDPQPTCTLGLQGSEPAFNMGIGIRCRHRCQDCFYSGGSQEPGEGLAELTITVSDQMGDAIGYQPAGSLHGQVTRCLRHDNLIGMLMDDGDMDTAGR
jgi:hypothetical protein